MKWHTFFLLLVFLARLAISEILVRIGHGSNSRIGTIARHLGSSETNATNVQKLLQNSGPFMMRYLTRVSFPATLKVSNSIRASSFSDVDNADLRLPSDTPLTMPSSAAHPPLDDDDR